MSADSRACHLTFTDDGPGFPDGFSAGRDANLGLALVTTFACHDLGGRAAFTNDGGAKVEVTFPVARTDA